MKPSEQLYEAVKDIWAAYNDHPFVQGIADGTLDHEKFRFYMIQDSLYLHGYAKVFAWGMIKSQTEEDIRAFAALISGALSEESENHQKYMEILGITPEIIAQTPVALTTESYTSYMLKIAAEEGPAEIATAVLACAWGYALIGAYVGKFTEGRKDPFFAHWIDTYDSEEYLRCNDETIALVDRLAKDYTPAQMEHLTQILINCSRYEAMFWDMAWNKEM